MAIKADALKTQQQKHKIDLQTGECIVDRLILQRAFDWVGETVWNMDQDEIAMKVTKEHGLVRNATKGLLLSHKNKWQTSNLVLLQFGAISNGTSHKKGRSLPRSCQKHT
jgi:hypothetical protein